jgi:hypothetical protein
MYKSILAILLIGLLAAPAMAVPPPGGWGNDLTTWHHQDGFFSDFALHNSNPPDYCGDIAGWTVFVGLDPQQYPFAAVGSIELWVELYASMTCYNTHWQFHRIADAGFTIEFVICGVVQSNNGIIVTISGNGQPMGIIRFIENVFGVDDGSGSDYAVSYWKASGNGAQIPQNKDWESAANEVARYGTITFTYLEPCDHWWCIRGVFCVEYHAPDGYYLLALMACPLPLL